MGPTLVVQAKFSKKLSLLGKQMQTSVYYNNGSEVGTSCEYAIQ